MMKIKYQIFSYLVHYLHVNMNPRRPQQDFMQYECINCRKEQMFSCVAAVVRSKMAVFCENNQSRVLFYSIGQNFDGHC